MNEIVLLRDVTDDDLPILFENQRDPAANSMADVAPRDAAAFDERWKSIRSDGNTIVKVMIVNDRVVGMILSFIRDGERELGYWIGQAYWGRGFATQAVRQFLKIDLYRPLAACVVKDNRGSLRVLQKNGFVLTGEKIVPALYRGGKVYLCQLKLTD